MVHCVFRNRTLFVKLWVDLFCVHTNITVQLSFNLTAMKSNKPRQCRVSVVKGSAKWERGNGNLDGTIANERIWLPLPAVNSPRLSRPQLLTATVLLYWAFKYTAVISKTVSNLLVNL